MMLRRRRSDDDDNGDDGVLKTRVSRQKQGNKEKEEERPLNRFYSNKNTAPPGPFKHGMRMQRSISHHNWHSWNDGRHTSTQRYSSMGRFWTYPSSTKAELTYCYKKNPSTMKQWRVTSQGTQELGSYRKNLGISQITRTSAEKRMTTHKTIFSPL